jgi:hypothetical protein
MAIKPGLYRESVLCYWIDMDGDGGQLHEFRVLQSTPVFPGTTDSNFFFRQGF